MTDPITFDSLLTAAGAGIAAAIITSLVELVKTVWRDMPVSGASLAFILSAILYGLAAWATGTATLDGALGVFIAWLTCATASVGVYATLRHYSPGEM